MMFDGINYAGTIYEDYGKEMETVRSSGDSPYDFERYVNTMRSIDITMSYDDYCSLYDYICKIIGDDEANELLLNVGKKDPYLCGFFVSWICERQRIKEKLNFTFVH